MPMCDDKYKTLGRNDFYDHIYHEVSVVADNVASKIEKHLGTDTTNYQNNEDLRKNGFDEQANNEPEEDEANRRAWKEGLGVDIKTLDLAHNSTDDAIRKPITDWVHEQLRPLKDRAKSLPDPEKAKALVDVMTSEKNGLYAEGDPENHTTKSGKLGDAARWASSIHNDDLASWQSPAGNTFKDKVLQNMHDDVIPSQQRVLTALVNLADFNYGTVLQAREDICRIAHAAADAAEDMDDGCGDGTDGGTDEDDEAGIGAYIGLGLAVAAIAVLAFPEAEILVGLTAAAGAGAGLSTAIEAFQEKEPAAPPEKDKRSFAAANWKELIQHVADAANEMSDKLDDGNSELSRIARDAMTDMTDYRDRYYVVNSGS